MRKFSSLSSLQMFTILSVFGAACADDGAADDGASTKTGETVQPATENLVAEVDGDGFKVRFLEPVPGLLVQDEKGTVEARHLPEDNNLDMVQRYELLAGKKAPAALVEAAERAGVPTHENDPVPQAADHSREKANPTSSEAWFLANLCTQTDRFWKGRFIGGSYWSDRVEYMKAAAWVSLGSVGYAVSYSGAGSWSWTLKSGEYNGRWATSKINRAASSEVISFGTDQVHHCVNYHY